MQLEQSLNSIELQYGSLRKAADAFGVDPYKIKAYYEDQIRNNLLVEQVKVELFSDIKVSRREVEEFYSTWQDSFPPKNPQVDFSILSVPVELAQNKLSLLGDQLRGIKQDIVSGKLTFEEAAKQYSMDPGSAANGGSLGFVGRGVFVKPFEEAAFALSPGELSDLIETQFGIHLLRLDEKVGDQIKVSHILLMPVADDNDRANSVNKLETLRSKIIAGETSLAEQVALLTEDDYIRSRKGRMGLTDLSNLPEDIHDLLLNIPLEKLSMPVFSGDQYHLIIVHQRISGGKINLTDHWAELESMTLEFKKRQRYENWITDQRERMYIQLK
jgi:peptidyl-prolyl cis-trans isomerase SurA